MIEPRFTTLSELARTSPRPPLVRVDEDGDLFLKLPNGADYWITGDRINTAEKLLGWIMHLSEKNWITPKAIRELIETAARHHGVKVERNL